MLTSREVHLVAHEDDSNVGRSEVLLLAFAAQVLMLAPGFRLGFGSCPLTLARRFQSFAGVLLSNIGASDSSVVRGKAALTSTINGRGEKRRNRVPGVR